jgi:hypothetical protein
MEILSFDRIISYRIYTREELQSAILERNRVDKIKDILNLIPDHDEISYGDLVNRLIDPEYNITSSDEFHDYLMLLSDEALNEYYSWLRCYLPSYYREIFKLIDPLECSFEEDTEIQRRQRVRNLIRDFLESGFVCLGQGTGRHVFEFNDFVIKVPYTIEGEIECAREVTSSQTHPDIFARVKPILYQAEDGTIHTKLNAMEKLFIPTEQYDCSVLYDEVRERYPKYLHWSWGYAADGQIKVYDFE